MASFDELTDRLVNKMERSQTPVPGFIVGLSGTDSLLAFRLVHEAAKRMGIGSRVVGIHYVTAARRRPTWFEESIIPWLRATSPTTEILVETPLGGNQDAQRWADLALRSINHVSSEGDGRIRILSRDPSNSYWTVGCTNATEMMLGKYSMLSTAVSIQPIRTILKTDVLAMCAELGVPEIAIANARIPDCLCGRDELAANHIELIDDILRYRVDASVHPADLLTTLNAYVADMKRANDWRTRAPYSI